MTTVENLPVERMSKAAFDSLPEYNTTLPTGTRVGKTWKRRVPSSGEIHTWMIGEYVKSAKVGFVDIDWRWIEVEEKT